MQSERRRMYRWVLGAFLLFLLIYWFMFTGQQVLRSAAPIFVGLVIAFPLNLLITFFQKHDILYHRGLLRSEKAHRVLSATLAVIVLLGCAVFIAAFLAPQLTASVITLLDKVPSGIRIVLTHPFFTHLLPKDTLETLHQVDWTNWVNHLISLVSSDELFRGMTVTATSALSAFSNLLFGILFACYFLTGRETARRTAERLVRAFVPSRKQEPLFHAGRLLHECFRSFFICQALQALIIGVSATVLMMLLGFPYASMIGALNGFCALVPVIGGYVGAILGTLIILTDSPGMALFFLVFIVLLQNIIGTLVFPRLIGRTLQLPAAWTLSAVLIGSGLAGISGILIGVPLTAFGYRWVKEKLEEKEAAQTRDASASPQEPPAEPSA